MALKLWKLFTSVKKFKPRPRITSSWRQMIAEHKHSTVTLSFCEPRFCSFWEEVYLIQTRPGFGYTVPNQAGEAVSTAGSSVSCQNLMSPCTSEKKYPYCSCHHYLHICVIIALTDEASQRRPLQKDKDKRMAPSLQLSSTKPLFSSLPSNCQVQLCVYVRSLSLIYFFNTT